MCNWEQKGEELSSRMGDRCVKEYFPQRFIQRHPPYKVQKEHCMECGTSLPYHEMRPAGRMPRYMCDYCYQQIALSSPKYLCLTCGGFLPQSQVQEQIRNPRELRYALHPGPCEEYHSMLAGIVLGVSFRMAQPNTQRLLPPAQQAYTLNHHLPPARTVQMVEAKTEKPLRQVKFLRWPE